MRRVTFKMRICWKDSSAKGLATNRISFFILLLYTRPRDVFYFISKKMLLSECAKCHSSRLIVRQTRTCVCLTREWISLALLAWTRDARRERTAFVRARTLRIDLLSKSRNLTYRCELCACRNAAVCGGDANLGPAGEMDTNNILLLAPPKALGPGKFP